MRAGGSKSGIQPYRAVRLRMKCHVKRLSDCDPREAKLGAKNSTPVVFKKRSVACLFAPIWREVPEFLPVHCLKIQGSPRRRFGMANPL